MIWMIQFGQLLENRECFSAAEQNSTHFYGLLINLIFFLVEKRVILYRYCPVIDKREPVQEPYSQHFIFFLTY